MAVDYPWSMSDESFRRPGSQPMLDLPSSNAHAAVWQPGAEPIIEKAAPANRDEQRPPVQGHRGPRMRNSAVIGLAGLLIGLIIGAIFIDRPSAKPLTITRDTFPREVFGQQRDGYSTPIVEGLDAQLQDQTEGYRFAYGGDGARFFYGKYAVTIVNGRMSTVLPIESDAASGETPWVASLKSGQTSCVSQNPPPKRPPQLELSDILADNSKDVFSWLDESRTQARTECVLYDDSRNLSIRLEGSGWVDNTLQTAGLFRDELVDIHARLTN